MPVNQSLVEIRKNLGAKTGPQPKTIACISMGGEMWDVERHKGGWVVRCDRVCYKFDLIGLDAHFKEWSAWQYALPESVVPFDHRRGPQTSYDKSVYDILVDATPYGAAACGNLPKDEKLVYCRYLRSALATVLHSGHSSLLRHYLPRVRNGLCTPENTWKLISRHKTPTWESFVKAKSQNDIREAFGRDRKGLRTRRHTAVFEIPAAVLSNDWLLNVPDAAAKKMFEKIEKSDNDNLGPLPYPAVAFISEYYWQPYLVLISEGRSPEVYFYINKQWVHVPQNAEFLLSDEKAALDYAIISCKASRFATTLPNGTDENADGIKLLEGTPRTKGSREVVLRILRPGRIVSTWGIQGSGSRKSPHMRRAHIRRLRDGREVVVRSCAINGGSKTIPPYAFDFSHSGGGIPEANLPS